jgi:hypothetical protein
MRAANLVKGILRFVWKLTRIELKYSMVARFTKLPAAIPWMTKNRISGYGYDDMGLRNKNMCSIKEPKKNS